MKNILLRDGSLIECEPFEGTRLIWIEGWGEENLKTKDRLFPMTETNKKLLQLYKKKEEDHKLEVEGLIKNLEKE